MPEPMSGDSLVLVAVKPLAAAKSRLDGVTAALRQRLVLAMLEDVLRAVRHGHPGAVWLLSPDRAYDPLAARLGVQRRDDRAAGYRPAVQAALLDAALDGWGSVLVLPADIPGLRSEDVQRMLEALADAEVLLVPGADGGTSALGLRPPQALPVAFGLDSASVHRRLAAGRRLVELRLETLAVDVDTTEDIEAIRGMAGPATAALLARELSGRAAR